MNIRWISLLVVAMIAASGCDDSDALEGAGRFEVKIYGEAFIEEGIPAEAFVDGWSVTFSKFLVVVDSVSLGDGAPLASGLVFDLAQGSGGGGHEVVIAEVPAGEYRALSYRVAPSAEAQPGNASADDVAMITAAGHSVWVEGVAVKEGVSLSFRWGFETSTRYGGCEIDQRVEDSGQGAAQLTIHADHLFYDDLVSEDPGVAFDLIAGADSDADQVVTLEELAAVDITAQDRYQVGSAAIDNLRDFIAAQTRTLGHIDGEGHCEAE